MIKNINFVSNFSALLLTEKKLNLKVIPHWKDSSLRQGPLLRTRDNNFQSGIFLTDDPWDPKPLIPFESKKRCRKFLNEYGRFLKVAQEN